MITMKNVLTVSLLAIGFTTIATVAEEKSMEELSQELANPLAQIWNLSFQYNHTTLHGNLVDGDQTIDTTLFQPVLPIPLEGGYTAFARPVVTYIKGPTHLGITGGTPSSPIGVGLDETSQFGDLILPMVWVGSIN